MVGNSTTFPPAQDFRIEMHWMLYLVFHISLWLVYEDLKLPCARNYLKNPILQFPNSSVFGHLWWD